MFKLFVYILSLLPIVSLGQTLKPVDAPGAVRFFIKNFGSEVEGSFTGLAGTIDFQPENLSASSLNVSIKASTIETGINMRNRHLKGEKYFDTDNFPQITIQSTGFKLNGNPNSYLMTAKLTIKGVTKTFSMPFTARNEKDGVLFEGSFTVNRRDFGVGAGSISLADQVRIQLKVMAKH